MSEDEINNPDHYNMNGMETIDLLQESMVMTEFEGYLKGNILKYVRRPCERLTEGTVVSE